MHFKNVSCQTSQRTRLSELSTPPRRRPLGGGGSPVSTPAGRRLHPARAHPGSGAPPRRASGPASAFARSQYRSPIGRQRAASPPLQGNKSCWLRESSVVNPDRRWPPLLCVRVLRYPLEPATIVPKTCCPASVAMCRTLAAFPTSCLER